MEIIEIYAELICEDCKKVFPTSKRCFENRKPFCRSCLNRKAQLNRKHIIEAQKSERDALKEKICKDCNELKNIDLFDKASYKNGNTCIRNTCKECLKTQKKQYYKKQVENDLGLSSNRSAEAWITKIIYKASKRNKLFEIDKEYVLNIYKKQNGKCALSGQILTFHKNNLSSNISIDRIDSSKGYVIGNIQLVCTHVNIMKWDKSTEELLSWCEKIILNTKNGK
jgi:hypothetical protein